jgi:hypothetical protein
MRPYMKLVDWFMIVSICTMEQHYPVYGQSGETIQFWFFSIGKRSVLKCIRFSPMDHDSDLFNLSLLDYVEDSESFCDNVQSNNGDVKMVFMTIAHCIDLFFQSYPQATLTFSGNTESRNRLYRMQLNRYQDLWREKYRLDFNTDSSGCLVFYCKIIFKFESP